MNLGPRIRRIIYVLALLTALAVWLATGQFDAVEAPYVGF